MSIYGWPHKTSLAPYGASGRALGPLNFKLMINLELALQIAGSFQGDLCDLAETSVTPQQVAQQGDGDIVLVVTVIDGNTGDPADLSAANPKALLIKKPSGATASYPAAFATNGYDGRLSVALSPADLDEAGYYFAQANFTVAAVAKSTLQGNFRVGENIVIDPD